MIYELNTNSWLVATAKITLAPIFKQPHQPTTTVTCSRAGRRRRASNTKKKAIIAMGTVHGMLQQ